jgi:hypothetical protein
MDNQLNELAIPYLEPIRRMGFFFRHAYLIPC